MGGRWLGTELIIQCSTINDSEGKCLCFVVNNAKLCGGDHGRLSLLVCVFINIDFDIKYYSVHCHVTALLTTVPAHICLFKGQMRDVLCTIICFIHCAVEALAQLTRACLSDKAALLLQKANTEASWSSTVHFPLSEELCFHDQKQGWAGVVKLSNEPEHPGNTVNTLFDHLKYKGCRKIKACVWQFLK